MPFNVRSAYAPFMRQPPLCISGGGGAGRCVRPCTPHDAYCRAKWTRKAPVPTVSVTLTEYSNFETLRECDEDCSSSTSSSYGPRRAHGHRPHHCAKHRRVPYDCDECLPPDARAGDDVVCASKLVVIVATVCTPCPIDDVQLCANWSAALHLDGEPLCPRVGDFCIQSAPLYPNARSFDGVSVPCGGTNLLACGQTLPRGDYVLTLSVLVDERVVVGYVSGALTGCVRGQKVQVGFHVGAYPECPSSSSCSSSCTSGTCGARSSSSSRSSPKERHHHHRRPQSYSSSTDSSDGSASC